MQNIRRVITATLLLVTLLAASAAAANAWTVHRYPTWFTCVYELGLWKSAHPGGQIVSGECFYDANQYWFFTNP